MKQRISVDDLWKLAPEQREKLWEWWVPKEEGIIYVMGNGDIRTIDEIDIKGRLVARGWDYDPPQAHKKDECLPLLNIGQLIELLKTLTYIRSIEPTCRVARHNWKVIVCDNSAETIEIIEYYGGELCDALWEAVKETL